MLVVIFDEHCNFQVLLQRLNGFVLLKKRETVFKVRPVLLGSDGVDVTARYQSPKVDYQIWFLRYSMLETVRDLVSNTTLYEMCDEKPNLHKYRF